MAANLAIMRNVRVGHDQVVIADPRASAALHRSAIDGDKLANLVMVANLQPRRFARIRNVLWSRANRTKGGEAIVSANCCRALNNNV